MAFVVGPATPGRRTARPAAPLRPHPADRTPALPALALQRQAGSDAVRGMLVQRFVGHEHESLGDATGDHVDLGHGVLLSWGQVVALAGDEFGTVDELRAATATEDGRLRIKAALRQAHVRGPVPASLDVAGDPATVALREHGGGVAQGAAFLELALRNVSHFAAGGDALATWRAHHRRALDEAAEAGLSGDESAFEQARATEAFGQHFLTDMLSGGHVRVPRRDIVAWYADRSAAMADALVDHVRTQVEEALVAQVLLQVTPAMRGLARRHVREQVHAAVGARLDEGVAAIGGRARVAEYVGLGVAGAVSGALHDRDGELGVVVASEDHPTPWLAHGDALLDLSPESRRQAESAVLAGREQLLVARALGAREERLARIAPSTPPAVVHFAFDSADLDPATAAACEAAGAFLHVHPGHYVELVGHTDPTGEPAHNLGLGQRRADAVRAALVAAGASGGQVIALSAGESSPVGAFAEDRRVELHWAVGTSPTAPATDRSVDARRERAAEAVAALGPPYDDVERYVPHAVESMNEPLPEWRWGSMSPELVAGLDRWVGENLAPHTEELLLRVPETVPEGDRTIAPRQAVAGVLAGFLAAPARTLGRWIGTPPGG